MLQGPKPATSMRSHRPKQIGRAGQARDGWQTESVAPASARDCANLRKNFGTLYLIEEATHQLETLLLNLVLQPHNSHTYHSSSLSFGKQRVGVENPRAFHKSGAPLFVWIGVHSWFCSRPAHRLPGATEWITPSKPSAS